jgi:hypothetical protein
MGQTTGCKAVRPVLVAAKHVGFLFLAIHDTFVSSSAHGHGQFQFMIESPMLLAIRWAHAHDNPSPPMLHPTHVAASFGSKTAQQLFKANTWHIQSLPRANGVCFPQDSAEDIPNAASRTDVSH